MTDEPADSGNFLGAFIRAQRQMANLSLRELAAMTEISNPYLSQIERWLSEPSAPGVEVDCRGAQPIRRSTFAQAGLIPESSPRAEDATQTAIRTDPRLSEPQKRALLSAYRSYIAEGHEKTNGARASDGFN
jgi:transcriptional regulator with XRE-family HTH domain